MTQELERLRKSIGGELVPYGAYEPREHGRPAGIDADPDPRRDELGQRASRAGWAAAAASSRSVTPSIAA